MVFWEILRVRCGNDELGVKKLPKVKELNAEYAGLLSGKKAAYAEYRKLRDEAQELSVAVRNIASLYDAELQEQQKIKEEKTHWSAPGRISRFCTVVSDSFFISGKVKKILM